MENILGKLLVADNATILQGTNELRQAFKSPDAIPALCNVLSTSTNSQVRQYAAVVLRKRLGKQKHWSKLTPDTRKSIKDGILPVLVNEKEKFVKNSVAQFVGTVAKHELAKSNWPELYEMIHQLLVSGNVEDNVLGLFTLSVLTDVAYEALKTVPAQFHFLFNTFFTSRQPNVNVDYYLIIIMTHIAPLCETDVTIRNAYMKHIPYVVEAIKIMAASDEEKASECLELFDEISEIYPAVLGPHVPLIIDLCLIFAKNKDLGDSVRNKALCLIGWITRIKKKSIVKHQLVKPIIQVLFHLMCEPPGDDDDEPYFADDDDDGTPSTNATQTLDIMALHLPADKLLSEMLDLISLGVLNDSPYVKRASYMALAMLAEGCAEYLMMKYLKPLVECVCKGITDPTPVVRNAALFALGQFSEHLQPEISKFAGQVMPILFQYLTQLCAKLQSAEAAGKDPPGVDRMFYALEAFCENLEEELLQYLPGLMEHLLLILQPKHSVRVQELGLSVIGAAAGAAKLAILPFFPKIIEHLKVYLLQVHEPDTVCLQVQAVDTLAILARTLGPEHFGPLAQETMQLGLRLTSSTDDPDLRKAAFGLFGALSRVVKEEFASYLPKIVELMVESLKSTEGLVSHFEDDENGAFPVYEDLSDTPDEEDIEDASDVSSDSVVQYSVENSYLEEKEEACLALKELAEHTGGAFLPYLQQTFDLVLKLVTFPQEDLRKAAIETLAEFCISFSNVDTPEGVEALSNAMSVVVPRACELVRMDEERSVAGSALDSLCRMLKEMGQKVLAKEGHKEAIFNCIKDILTNKTKCQDEETDGSEGEESEQDELLMEAAGNLIPVLAINLPAFETPTFFADILPIIVSKTKNKESRGQQTFFAGILAECMTSLGPQLASCGIFLLGVLLPLTKSDHADLRQNSIYGLGELVLHGKEALFPHYQEILETLSTALSKETSPGAIDNICGALARLIVSNTSLVPVDMVLPAFLGRLPLKEDMDEHVAVMRCLNHLYKGGHPTLVEHMSDLIRICATIVCKEMGNQVTLTMAVELLKCCSKDFSSQFTSTMHTMGEDVAARLVPLTQQH